MKVRFLASATAIVETADARILMDPWLCDGIYYGSWSHWPPYQWNDADFEGLTHIFVSHIHPDHCDRATMMRLPHHLPVIIHRFDQPFLKRNLESLGFQVIELPNGIPYRIGDTALTIRAADDCNPEVCGRFFSCAAIYSDRGSTQIDSLIHITDGKHHIINTNDCPYPLASHMLPTLPQPDLLMTSYGAAGPFPQCFVNFTGPQKMVQADVIKRRMRDQALGFAKDLKPAKVFPFAGQYVLSGRLASLNKFLGVPEVDLIYDDMEQEGLEVARIARGATYDLATQTTDQEYTPVDVAAKQEHIERVLAKRNFEFDADPEPSRTEEQELVTKARERLEHKRRQHGLVSPVTVIANNYELSMGAPADGSYLKMNVDSKLFTRLMRGPRFAHWNNVEIGSHIRYDRRPNVFNRGISHIMSFFHA